MRELNFNNLKKNYMRVVLADAAQTTLDVKMATKETITELLGNYSQYINLKKTDLTNLDYQEVMTDSYTLCATLLSYNRQGKTFTADKVKEMWEEDDLTYFLKAYVAFVNETVRSKNSLSRSIQ